MEELSRKEVVELAERANFGMNEIRKDVTKFEKFAWLVQLALEEKANAGLSQVQ